jgi:hypothetical protein
VEHANQLFQMYSGDSVGVKLRFHRSMVNAVVDRFGHDIIMIPQDDDTFTVTLPLVLSPQFYGWLFGLEDNVVITAPQWAVDAYRNKLAMVSRQYQP